MNEVLPFIYQCLNRTGLHFASPQRTIGVNIFKLISSTSYFETGHQKLILVTQLPCVVLYNTELQCKSQSKGESHDYLGESW